MVSFADRGRTGKKAAKTGTEALITPEDRLALPILTNSTNEQKLVQHILDRLRLSSYERDARVARISAIDLQISGGVALDKDEKKRDKENKEGKKPKPVSHNLPLADAQLEDAVTFMLSIFAPDTGIFEAIAPKDLQSVAKAVVAEFNKDAKRGQYYRQFAKFCINALRYNFAAMTNYWEAHTGIVFTPGPGGAGVQKSVGNVWEGNLMRTESTYNFLFDTSVHPVDVPTKGEFFATVETLTPFQARRMGSEKKLFGVNRFANMLASMNNNNNSQTTANWRFYRPPATIREDMSSASTSNWIAKLGGVAQDSRPFLELVNYVTWIIPSQFGLSASKELELWRIKLVNGMWIGYAQKLEDTHGMLPVVIACPVEDDLNNDQRTYAEKLIPLQHFASFLLNTHQDAVRKAIYGLTLYNPNAFPGIDKTQEALFCGVIPMRASATDIDIDKVFRHYNDAPETAQNVDMVGKVQDLMQRFLPTDMLKQVTDLDRATRYQAAATVQAGNRRNFKTVRMTADQAFNILIIQMLANLVASGKQLNYIDDTTGQNVPVTSSMIAGAEIENYIGTGLRGLDRLQVIDIYTDMLNAILQSPNAYAEFDVVMLMNYISSVAGDYTDMAQFRRTPEAQQQIINQQNQGKPVAQSAAGPQQAGGGAAPATPGGTR